MTAIVQSSLNGLHYTHITPKAGTHRSSETAAPLKPKYSHRPKRNPHTVRAKFAVAVDAPAGSGKTSIGIATATLLQAYRVVDSCLYIRTPAAEGRIGFLPGDQKSKERPYMQPLYNTIVKIGEDPMAMIEGNDYESQKYQSAPWKAVTDVYMLGEDFERTAVVIDEAQCMTVDQLKTVITRCHDDCKVIVIGSTLQIQGIAKDKSGFTRCIEHFKDKEWARICTLEKNYRGLMSAWADRM